MPTSSTSSSTSSASSDNPGANFEQKDQLMTLLKKEVKHIMEESVMLKTIHEDSSTVTSLCAVVDTCLKRRALGLFKTSSTMALMQKLVKENKDAEEVMKKVTEIEQGSGRRAHSTGDSGSKLTRSGTLEKANSGSNLAAVTRYMWIRVALFEKRLQRIICHLVQESDRYYTKDSLIADQDYGPILSSLLVGPCALEYTKIRANGQIWTDLPANELVQRHKISSGSAGSLSVSSTTSMPSPVHVQAKRSLSHASSMVNIEDARSMPTQAREYVESLHQNQRDSLLYGKNNVKVFPKDSATPQAGYLSLHQSQMGTLVLKWTPNLLMNGSTLHDKNASWQQAVSADIGSILFMHCHQDKDESGTLIMIANDGTQHPPLQFPPGGHLMQFLTCLESCLSPHGVLEPPLASTGEPKEGVEDTPKKTRRLLPLLKRRKQITDSTEINESHTNIPKLSLAKPNSPNDFVFKIVPLTPNSSLSSAGPLLRPPGSAPADFMGSTGSLLSTGSLSQSLSEYSGPDASTSTTSSHNPNDILEEDGVDPEDEELVILSESNHNGHITNLCLGVSSHSKQMRASPSEPLSTLCHTMKRQIFSRAFYGWLSHVRQLRTARQHLSDLAFHDPLPSFNNTWSSGVTTKWWNEQKKTLLKTASPYASKESLLLDELQEDPSKEAKLKDLEREIHLRIYYGGIEPCVRKQWSFDKNDIDQINAKTRASFENKLSDWMAIEAIVRQRDKETAAANIAKLSGVSASVENTSFSNSINMSNEVFESVDDPLSSRTVSADKISTITECTENSENNSSERFRGKLHSTQSEPSPRSRRQCSDEGIEDERSLQNGKETSHSDDERGNPNEVPSRGILVQGRHPENHAYPKKEVSYKITTPSVDSGNPEPSPTALVEDQESSPDFQTIEELKNLNEEIALLGSHLHELPDDTLSSASGCQSPISSEGGMYPQELVDNFALNLHRIDKDVQRCDRNLAYFTDTNLEKLRNVITTYVWENLDVGYMQGMCDLVAPILVIFDDEAITHACFSKLMERMLSNFPTGTQMDENFANMRSLIQVLDQTLYDTIQQNGDFSHFYFCYRWFLLDFKREFTYHEIYLVWETIWASRKVVSSDFYLFVALALVENYRDIILDRNMDFTDIIKFFNEMAEKHHARDILQIARDLVHQLQTMISDY
ncbi:hypothetical protein TCAL_11740 [Tigriopus californicus]|uniref:Rab-GAP TBC domain-containing protein n=1 Tax=Tigriopus californicus TaxID=6832 RepID=A0A553PRK8_TIGCA|nr:hypothetical protein TCAL_11740 [Tigriopus californicus]